MTEHDVPKIVTNGDLSPKPPEHIYVHLDDYEDVDISPPDAKQLHIYIFEDEDRKEELLDVIHDLRQDYITATGVRWPAWIGDRVEEFEVEMLKALEWVIALGERPEPGDVEVIEEHL